MGAFQRPTGSSATAIAYDDIEIYRDADVAGSAPGFYARVGKRALDIVLVLLAVPFFLPLVALSALAVMTDGHKPFYVQERVGRGGRNFRMLKLRSMVVDAERLLERHLEAHPEAREEWHRDQKLREDPRITRVGWLIRKTSIDELPQLWNVLRGDMSLVGPRPMTPSQVDLYPGRAYYSLRPGVTGLWQICDRNSVTFAGRAAFDETYARDITFREDLRIMLRTPGVMLRGTGM